MTDICVLGDSISKGIVFDDLKERYAVLNDNFISSAKGVRYHDKELRFLRSDDYERSKNLRRALFEY